VAESIIFGYIRMRYPIAITDIRYIRSNDPGRQVAPVSGIFGYRQ